MNSITHQQTVAFKIAGMSCASCVARIEKALLATDGVVSANVNFATETAQVTFKEPTSETALFNVVKQAGYSASPIVSKAAVQAATVYGGYALLFAALFTLPLVVPMLGDWFGQHWMVPVSLQWLFASIVQFYFGRRFYQGAYAALKAKAGNMDSLVVLGTSAAYGLSVFNIYSGQTQQLYFESAAVIITLVMLGKWLEANAKNQTTNAIRALQNLRPETANLLRNNQEVAVPAESLVPGDVILIKAGERIAADGIIEKGSSFVNEAMLTGESLPIAKHIGDKVIGGAINLDGLLVVKVTTTSAESVLAKIVQLVVSAQQKKSPIQKLVDRISAIFVPVVLVVALITLLAWGVVSGDWQQAILSAVAVLVIACPCALGLATPTAIMVGTGMAAKQGILIKDAEILEATEHIDVVAFDKTGTLTEGKPQVVQFTPFISTENDLLGKLLGLQQGSEHPLAKAIITYASSKKINTILFDTVVSLPGLGIRGQSQHSQYWFGNQGLMASIGITSVQLKQAQENIVHAANTLSWLAQQTDNGEVILAGLVQFRDTIKSTAYQTIAQLKQLNIASCLLTGDTQASAQVIAKQLGIDHVRAEVMPADKAAVVAKLQEQGKKVAMVGDGINDTPALAQANVGIAMGAGADVAMQTAGITLMHSDPLKVVAAIAIAKKTQQKIRQNLFWAFIYNVIGIPLAAFGLLNPMVAGAIMAASSVSVVLNALLLKRFSLTKLNPVATEKPACCE